MSDIVPAVVPEIVFNDEPEDPKERAHHRLGRLARSFGEVLATIAQMYKDEDWKYIEHEDGTPYTNLTDVIRDHLNVSLAMARRYVQGARDIYLPLQGLVVEGTPIQITAGDVAALGVVGAQEVVERTASQMTGLETPSEAAEIVSDTIKDVREGREQERRDNARHDEFEDDGYGDEFEDDGDHSYESYDGPVVDGRDAYTDLVEDPVAEVSTPGGTDEPGATVEDEIDALMAGADEYTTDDAIASLPEQLQEVARALHVLASIDPAEVASHVNYATRGVIIPVGDVQNNMHKLRANVETSSWFLAHLR